MKIIDVRNLSYDYVRRDENDKVVEKSRALSDLNLTIEEGSFVCILGHNGSGKSTFAKLLDGLELPAEGTVLVSGRDTREEEALWEIRKETGMVFQNPDNQIIASVVEEDVGFGPENIGVPTPEIWKRVDRALETVQMTAYRRKSPNRLSGGQKQRVAIARALALEPKILFFDEPTSALDPELVQDVLDTMKELAQEGWTMVVVTHEIKFALEVATTVVVMDGGVIVEQGSPQDLFNHPKHERTQKFLRQIRADNGDLQI